MPYHRCARWRAHAEYFATRGLAPWLDGEVPHQATDNHAFARAHADLLLRLVQALVRGGRLSRGEDLSVLEVGGGPGWFAASFLRALRDELGTDGRRLLRRLRYFFSDASPSILAEATAREDLSGFVQGGVVVPLLFDALAPASARSPEGPPVGLRPLLVVANYVCCVLPARLLRKSPQGWSELHAAADSAALPFEGSAQSAPTGWAKVVGAHEWRATSAEELFSAPTHRVALERALGAAQEAEVAYPEAFLDFVDAVVGSLRPGGVVVFSDFPDESYEGGIERADRIPSTYGGSLAQPVCFPAVRAFVASRGLRLLESRGCHGATRTVLLSATPVPRPVETLFEASFVDANAGQDLLDFAAAAKALGRAGDASAALRFYDRCLGLAPRDPALYLHAGEEALAAGDYRLAVTYFRRGAEVDPRGAYDFDCRIGEVYSWTAEAEKALPHLEAALRSGETAGKFILLGDARARLLQPERARAAYDRALDLEPGHPAALEGLRQLGELSAREEPPPRPTAPAPSTLAGLRARGLLRPTRSALRTGILRLRALRSPARSSRNPGRSA